MTHEHSVFIDPAAKYAHGFENTRKTYFEAQRRVDRHRGGTNSDERRRDELRSAARRDRCDRRLHRRLTGGHVDARSSAPYRVPIMSGLIMAVFVLVMAVVGVFILSFIINALAPTFGAQKNSAQAFKVAVYSYTPAWLAGVFQIIPALGVPRNSLPRSTALYLALPRACRASCNARRKRPSATPPWSSSARIVLDRSSSRPSAVWSARRLR